MKLTRSVLYFFATLLIYLGWPLIGWGLGGITEFFSSEQRLGYAIVVLLFSVAVGIQAYPGVEGIRGKSGEKGKLVFRQRLVRVALVLALFIALFLIPFFDRRGLLVFENGDILRWVGVPLAALGFTLIFWSGLALGRQYSADVTIQSGHKLITSSIYRFIRHPRYLGVMGLAVGVASIFRSWIGLIASVVLVGVLLFRIRDEEAVMRREFAAGWEDYCKSSWRLIPYVY